MKKAMLLSLVMIFAFTLMGYAQENTVNLTGTVVVTNRMHAELTADGKQYQLLLPRYYLFDMKDGDTLQVEGVIAKADDLNNRYPRGIVASDTPLVIVSKLTINGKTVDIDRNQKRGGGNRQFKRGNNQYQNCPMFDQ